MAVSAPVSRNMMRRFIAATAVTMIASFVLTACTAPWIDEATPEPHESFSYAKFVFVDPASDYRPGDSIVFTWETMSNGIVYEAKPEKITLRAGLYGPFESVEQLKEQMMSIRTPIHTDGGEMIDAVAQIDPIQTDSWTNETYTSTLTLPDTLRPGYYAFIRSATSASDRGYSTGEGQSVLEIVAR